jgi:hypothetical protein
MFCSATAGALSQVHIHMELQSSLTMNTSVIITSPSEHYFYNQATLAEGSDPVFSTTRGKATSDGTWNFSLELYVLNHTIASRLYTVILQVQNPPFKQTAPTFKIQTSGLLSTSSLTVLDSGVGSTKVLAVAGVSAQISQSTPIARRNNKLTLGLEFTVPFRVGERVTIEALKGAFRQSGGISLQDESFNNSCGAFASCHTFFSSQPNGEQGFGMWLHEAMILYVVKPLEVFVRYQFSFNVTNPSYSQNPPPIFVAATGFNFSVKETLVSPGLGNAAALYVSGFLMQVISQSNPSQGALNTIQISLLMNIDFYGNITVSGLQGSSTSSQLLALSSIGNEFSNVASWSQAEGILVVTAHGLLKNVTYSFSFDLENSMSGQVSPLVQIFGEGAALIPNTNMTKGDLNTAPLLVAGFVEAYISQSTASQFGLNTITVRVRCIPGFSLMQGSIIRIYNLVGSSTPSSSALEIQSVPSHALSHMGSFNSTTGTLDVFLENTVWAQSTSSSVDLLFNFTVTNGARPTCIGGGCSGQSPPILFISMHGVTNIFKTALRGVAMLIADFGNLAIAQNTSAAGAMNTITLRFSTRAELVAGSTVTLDGLKGFCTLEPSVDLTDAAPFQPKATFSLFHGILKFHIGATPSIANVTYSVRFVLKNCLQPNNVANSLKISASASGVYIAPTALPASNIALVAGFLNPAEIFQQTPSAGGLNVLNVSNIRVNLDLPSNFITHITVIGLTGSLTSSNPHLEIMTDSSSAGVFSSTADWHKESGRLVVALQTGITVVAGKPYSFRFTLRNTLVSQPSPLIRIVNNVMGQYEVIKGKGNQSPLLIAGFTTKDIGQFIAHRKTLNTLTVTLSVNCILPIGSYISLDLGITLPASLTVNAIAGGLASSDVSMDTQGSSVLMTLQKQLQPLQLYIWAFNLTNPETEQAAPTITICANTVMPCSSCPIIACTNMTEGQGAQAALRVHHFFPAFRAECDDLASGWNSISKQSFGPRRGFGMVAINGVPLLNGSGLMLEDGIWNSAKGEVSFKIAAGKTLQAGKLYALSFAVTNPLSGVLATSISLEVRGSFPATPWAAPNSGLSIQSGWRVLKMVASSFYPGDNNTLSLTLAANIDIVSPCVLNLVGLTGSNTADTSSLAIRTDDGADNIFAHTGTWVKDTGSLQVSLLPGAKLLASTSFYKITFALQNGLVAQPGRAVGLTVAGSCSLATLPVQQVQVPDVLLPLPGAQLGVGDAAPLKIVASGFVLKSVGQLTHFPGSINTIVCTFAVSAKLASLQTLQLSGLSSASISSSNVSLTLAPFLQGLLKPSATISAGVLSIQAESGATLIPRQVYIFSFDVYNPSTKQESPNISILATNGMQTFEASASKAAGNGAPLKVSAPGFIVGRISQSNCIANAKNHIIATIGLNIPLNPSVYTQIVFSGLVGLQTPSGVYSVRITSEGSTAEKCFESVLGFSPAIWDQTAGMLTINTTSHQGCNSSVPLAAGMTFAVNFSVTNPALARSGVNVTVSVVGFVAATLLLENDVTTTLSSVLGALPGHAAPLQICAGWALAKISQSNPYPDNNNTITVSLISFSRLSAGTGLTVAGLLGAQTSSSDNFTVSPDIASASFWRTAQWDRETGSVSLSIADNQLLEANTLHVFSFTLLNPGQKQSSQSTSIFSMEAESVMGVTMQTESNFILPIPGAVPGDTAPMLVKARGFALKTLGQSNPFPGAANTIGLTIAINSLQTPVAKILIQGLYGPGVDTPTTIPISQVGSSDPVFEATAQWQGHSNSSSSSEEYGGSILTLTVASSKAIQVGKTYRVSLDFVNPWAAQSAANHVNIIAASEFYWIYNEVADFAETVLAFPGAKAGDARPFRILTPGFTMATVSQSAPYSGYSNVITISFATSANLTADHGSHITVHGLVGNKMLDSQRLVVAGGYADPYTSQQPAISADTDFSAGLLNDVWISNENGSHWKLFNTSQPWIKREGHSLLYHAGGSRLSPDSSSSALFLIGGRTILQGRNWSRAACAILL